MIYAINQTGFLNFYVFILGLLKTFKENMCKNSLWISNNAFLLAMTDKTTFEEILGCSM